MSRKELLNVYDQMRPGEEQKAEMFRNILKMSSEDTDKETDRTKVILYKEKRGISVSGICKAAAAAACAGLVIFGGIHFIQKNAEQTEKLANNDMVQSEGEKEQADDNNSPADINELLSNDAVLTDSSKRYRAELVDLPEGVSNVIGVYNGNALYVSQKCDTISLWAPISDLSQKNYFTDKEGNVLQHVSHVISGNNYIAVNDNLKDLYIYDNNMVNKAVISGYGIYGEAFGPDETIYFYSYDGNIYKSDLDGNILAQISKDQIISDDSDMYYIVDDIYVMKNGNVALGIYSDCYNGCHTSKSEIFIFDPDLENYRCIPAENTSDIICEYNGGLIMQPNPYVYNSETVLYYLDTETGESSVFSDLGRKKCICRGCGKYAWFIIEGDTVSGYIIENDTYEKILSVPDFSETNNVSFFSNDKELFTMKTDDDINTDYYSINIESKEEKEINQPNGLGLWYEIITPEGHIRSSQLKGNIHGYSDHFVLADIDIETGEAVYTDISDDTNTEYPEQVYYTENYFCIKTISEEEGSDGSGNVCIHGIVYSNDNEKKYEIPGLYRAFTLYNKDILVYNTEYDYVWTAVDLKTGNKIVMKNDIPGDWQRIWQGRGKYDFFFASEKGIYGGVIEGDEFRYCMLVDFSRLEIPESIHSDAVGLGEPVTPDYICQFYYDDDDNIYIATRNGCDLMKLKEIRGNY